MRQQKYELAAEVRRESDPEIHCCSVPDVAQQSKDSHLRVIAGQVFDDPIVRSIVYDEDDVARVELSRYSVQSVNDRRAESEVKNDRRHSRATHQARTIATM